MNMQFKKATKQQAKLRMAIFGPSGAGKTYTALRVATGIGGKIAVIDTERGSASKYSDRFDFDVLELEDANINVYQQAIQAAAQGGYNILIMDSLSHAWQELLIEIDKLASTKFSGNTWAAWSKGTPKQRQFIDAILQYPGHIIATMRVKTEWVEGERNGKKTYTRVGLNPEQGKGIEYEFDLLLEMSVDHVGMVAKDRTGKFQDKTIDKPSEDFGRDLAAWLSDGAKREDPPTTPATVAAAEELGGQVTETRQEPGQPPAQWPAPGTPAPNGKRPMVKIGKVSYPKAWIDRLVEQYDDLNPFHAGGIYEKIGAEQTWLDDVAVGAAGVYHQTRKRGGTEDESAEAANDYVAAVMAGATDEG
jgi:hypothetical protein